MEHSNYTKSKAKELILPLHLEKKHEKIKQETFNVYANT